jgi:deazaflavin-dependent oxidoreductase (nitroreductase family)
MPLPQSLARFNARVTNKVTGPFAGRLPGFAVVRHVGRRSGRAYETPVNLFRDRDGDRFVVALTYGSGSQWVRNVLAAGGCTLRVRGADVEVTDPVVFTEPERRAARVPARWILGAVGADEFMRLTPTAGGPTASQPPGARPRS